MSYRWRKQQQGLWIFFLCLGNMSLGRYALTTDCTDSFSQITLCYL